MSTSRSGFEVFGVGVCVCVPVGEIRCRFLSWSGSGFCAAGLKIYDVKAKGFRLDYYKFCKSCLLVCLQWLQA